jgi:hypothetical protein
MSQLFILTKGFWDFYATGPINKSPKELIKRLTPMKIYRNVSILYPISYENISFKPVFWLSGLIIFTIKIVQIKALTDEADISMPTILPF